MWARFIVDIKPNAALLPRYWQDLYTDINDLSAWQTVSAIKGLDQEAMKCLWKEKYMFQIRNCTYNAMLDLNWKQNVYIEVI